MCNLDASPCPRKAAASAPSKPESTKPARPGDRSSEASGTRSWLCTAAPSSPQGPPRTNSHGSTSQASREGGPLPGAPPGPHSGCPQPPPTLPWAASSQSLLDPSQASPAPSWESSWPSLSQGLEGSPSLSPPGSPRPDRGPLAHSQGCVGLKLCPGLMHGTGTSDCSASQGSKYLFKGSVRHAGISRVSKAGLGASQQGPVCVGGPGAENRGLCLDSAPAPPLLALLTGLFLSRGRGLSTPPPGVGRPTGGHFR